MVKVSMSVLLTIEKGYRPTFRDLPSARILGGCLVLFGCGVCLAMILTFSFFAQSAWQGRHSETQTLLNQAKRDLEDQQSQKVLDALKPKLDQFPNVDEKSLAYEYLGQAEIQSGHFQFAALYFENMYALQPTAKHLYMLATAYDAGGDLRHALKNYQMLAGLSSLDAYTYRSVAEGRIKQLLEILTPGPSSSS
jgi:tetratricopeptide (TPR) repeat protein